MNTTSLRPLGSSNIQVTPVAMGCWPIAGVTSLDVEEGQSLATLEAAFDSGINFFDTAYCYGYSGESERLIGRALRDGKIGSRREIVIASKGGIHYGPDRKQARDGSPATLKRECRKSLQRLGTDYLDLLYLHGPDPQVPLAESAGALRELMDEGLTRSVGVSNVTTAQLAVFAAACPLTAFQPHYNLLQREIEASELPWCHTHNVAVCVYWPLMKGLLAGHMARDHQFDPRDGRAKYPMFRGEEFQRNIDFVEQLRSIAGNRSVTELVIAWTISRPGITVALCGAKRPHQIHESAAGMRASLSVADRAAIDQAIAQRGVAASVAAVKSS